ncbi:hypothetical protein NBRC10512_002790 [Rhodotorula toruloides]|uniref:RHTO0S11e04368g1_1 n=2 Tax=Rhodotorula toruloides TaxID=5286 RepID=A0A061BD14_RHOTO|nr:uncharacterized protein RHTO_01670 [Rhodotorula toruloides NP11]EMS21610.1 hypothetical protein RHTO_01670 [Rhodotorula toruloides NP11]CDR45760.1 RHTO0S11e04368g1_1 [Rhodotorula toruloides]
MANTDAPDVAHTQPPPPVSALSQLGPFARFQRWLEQSDTLEKRHFGLIWCPNYPSPGECQHCVLLHMGALSVYIVFIVLAGTTDPERFQMLLAGPWELTAAPIVRLIELGVRAVAGALLYILLMPLTPLLCASLTPYFYHMRPGFSLSSRCPTESAIATGVDLWLKYLAVTALFDVHVLPRLLNAAVVLERCLQTTQQR